MSSEQNTDGQATPEPEPAPARKKSGWARVGDVLVPALAWSAVAGVAAYSVKCAVAQTDPKSWREAHETLAAADLTSQSMHEDRLLFVLFRDVLTSCHVDDLESREYVRRAFYSADALLHLVVCLRSDGRVSAAFADADKAEQHAHNAVYWLLQVHAAKSKEHYLRLRGARTKLLHALARHMRSVKCLVLS